MKLYLVCGVFILCSIQSISSSRRRDSRDDRERERDYEFLPDRSVRTEKTDKFCDIDACQLMDMLEKRSAELEKKVRSLDQPSKFPIIMLHYFCLIINSCFSMI